MVARTNTAQKMSSIQHYLNLINKPNVHIIPREPYRSFFGSNQYTTPQISSSSVSKSVLGLYLSSLAAKLILACVNCTSPFLEQLHQSRQIFSSILH